MLRFPRKPTNERVPTGSRQDERFVPTGELVQLEANRVRPSVHNPRKLFDKEPLAALKKSIRDHGVLVPITVYRLPGQERYAIVDGERRFRCCSELVDEGHSLTIPANIVTPPNQMASTLYMFNIHQFRQQWELMPTAVALHSVIDELEIYDNRELSELTGLSTPQLERCKLILSFPDRYQRMSLHPDPKQRIPSNFWVELHPVLTLTETILPDLMDHPGRNAVIDTMIAKYRAKRVRSVIHFRRILEAYEVHAGDDERVAEFRDQLREYILTVDLETREAFDRFIADNRRVTQATHAADRFIAQIRRAKIGHTVDQKDELILKLTDVLHYVQRLLAILEGEDAPSEMDD